eukprot:180564_1
MQRLCLNMRPVPINDLSISKISITIEDLQMKKYIQFNSKYFLKQIRCHTKFPLIYIHTKHCYVDKILRSKKKFQVSCSKCRQELRNTKIWHCRCEKGGCKLHYNFCNKCYHSLITTEIEKQLIIKTWTNKDINTWINNTKWGNIPKYEVNSFRKHITNNIFNDMNGSDLIALTETDILNFSSALPSHWQYSFKSQFISNEMDKFDYYYIMKEQITLQRCEEQLFTLCQGFLRKYITGNNKFKYIGSDIIVLMNKYIIFPLVLKEYDLKILTQETCYIFDEIIMEPYSKLLI